MKTASKYTDIVQKVNLYLIVLVAFSLPFYRWISVYITFLWVLVFLIEGRFRQRFTGKKEWPVLILIISFFLFHFLGLIYSQNMNAGWFDVQVKLPFLIMPVLMFGTGSFHKRNNKNILLAFAGGNLIASLICLVAAIVRSFSLVNGEWIFKAELMGHNYSFWKMLINGGNNFMYEPLSLFHHPGYFSIYIVFSVVILIDLLISREIGKSRLTKILYLLLIFFFSIMVYLLFARAGMIALFVVLTGYMLYMIFRSRRKWLFVSFFIGLAVVGCVVMINNGRIRNSLYELKCFVSGSKQDISTDNRLLIWYYSLGVIKNNPLIGVGTGDVKDEMMKVYQEKNLEKAQAQKLNVHNQFLETAVQLGIPGLLLLLAIFIWPLLYALKHRNTLMLFFLLVNGVFFFFESALNLQAGIFYFAYMISFLLFVRNDKANITSSTA